MSRSADPALLLALLVALAAPADAATPDDRALAEAFAPVFVFHADETLFPCSPLLVTSPAWGATGVPPEAPDGRVLDDVERRVTEYLALPREDRLRAATVYYRVRTADEDRGPIVVEYWLYYLANHYSARGGIVPLRLSGEHPHDLERVFVILEPAPDGADAAARLGYRARTIIASAHAGGVPDNRYTAPPGRAVPATTQVLVERGSHAMAPDIDGDLVFDPAADAAGYRKLIWGIRDTGHSWARYHPSYADPREASTVIRLGAAIGDTRDAGYRLAPVADLEQPLDIDAWPEADRRRVLGSTYWLKGLFGEVDARQLLLPVAHAEGRREAGSWNRVASSDTALVAGFTNIISPFSPLIGVRHSWLTDSRWPDLQSELTAMFPPGQKATAEAAAFGTYPLDAITRLVTGVAIRYDEERNLIPIWMPGIEWRMSRWRFRTVFRNPHNDLWFDFRLYYLLF